MFWKDRRQDGRPSGRSDLRDRLAYWARHGGGSHGRAPRRGPAPGPAPPGARGELAAARGLGEAGEKKVSVARPVLVVDDDDFGRQTLGRILEAVGYSVLQAADGAEALRRLRRTPPAGLIILDLLMPGFDGWQFFEEQRSDPRLADIPVLVVSAVRPTEPRACFPGIVGHFAKPIAVPALLETVRRHWQPR